MVKFMESSNLGNSFTAVPPILEAELTHSRGSNVLVEGREEGREGKKEESEREEKGKIMHERRGPMQISKVSPRKCSWMWHFGLHW